MISDKNYKMETLLKHLRKFGEIKLICLDLENFRDPSHVVDTHKTFNTNQKNYQSLSSFEESSDTEIQYTKRVRPINGGLCVIINQIHFRKEVLCVICIKYLESQRRKLYYFTFFFII